MQTFADCLKRDLDLLIPGDRQYSSFIEGASASPTIEQSFGHSGYVRSLRVTTDVHGTVLWTYSRQQESENPGFAWKPLLIMKRISAALCGVLALAIAAPVAARGDGAINWSITPYLWAVETTVDLTADGTPIGGGKVSFSDLLDTTDTSLAGYTYAVVPCLPSSSLLTKRRSPYTNIGTLVCDRMLTPANLPCAGHRGRH